MTKNQADRLLQAIDDLTCTRIRLHHFVHITENRGDQIHEQKQLDRDKAALRKILYEAINDGQMTQQ